MADIATISYGSQQDYKRLYYSNPDAALKVPVTLQAGYGKLEAGTIMAENLSAAGNDGKFVPYNLTVFDGTETSPGRAYLVADATGVTYVYVTLDDSYKFVVGDDLIINDDGSPAENLGAITAIDRTTYSHMAKITATATISGTFGTADHAYVCVEAGDSSNNYSDAVGILEKTVDTGTGSTAVGAIATMILKNAVLYSGMLSNVDAAARTDLGASTFGQYTYL
jgi:hypothetical protein